MKEEVHNGIKEYHERMGNIEEAMEIRYWEDIYEVIENKTETLLLKDRKGNLSDYEEFCFRKATQGEVKKHNLTQMFGGRKFEKTR